MVSQRQRLAKKRFKEANPHLFPKPEPTPSDPAAKKKKKKKWPKRTLKGGVEKPTGAGGGNRKAGPRKHPLRVPGKKPGDGCFICNAQDHIAKLCPKKAEWERNKICLLCRRRGHSLKNCPKSNEDGHQKLCYNCGESGHSLSKCPEPLQDGGIKFANCFVCKEQGHLSKNCPKSTHGIYPKGGCCKVCGGITHLAKDCPKKGSRGPTASGVANRFGNSDTVLQSNRIVFRSGDDLEDDYTVEEKAINKKTRASDSLPVLVTSGSPSKTDANVKVKKKKGPKVVTFPG